MHFMDNYNYDIERVKRCVIHYAAPDGKLYPFCTYNSGPVYRERLKNSSPSRLKSSWNASPSSSQSRTGTQRQRQREWQRQRERPREVESASPRKAGLVWAGGPFKPLLLGGLLSLVPHVRAGSYHKTRRRAVTKPAMLRSAQHDSIKSFYRILKLDRCRSELMWVVVVQGFGADSDFRPAPRA